jgi:hypothetical protein
MQTETLSIRISKAEIIALRKRARQERISQGKLVRRALQAYAATSESKAKTIQSGYDRIKHLAGIYSGRSKDLSTNPRHFEGFGE